ncbi:uncharacterized protein BO88DRAFT_152980 [Aspergillus vadensis CBS 113365]|uniref:Uncharacterized protein n=1 Tax=Aspergillus vadensis (strain CBS 113365 / IMI 142717 / IBT 24658) TaxID=1448311 RepID=A0A319AYX5_ASPVC|nr:hypothetical protein BO88DRAFT_152980 [Aspergillus vadensis CBS 113365]PYH64784.1 hypothetical protein BO88DRAFT_152980 [Aspergillus vadensis CBS 113365]
MLNTIGFASLSPPSLVAPPRCLFHFQPIKCIHPSTFISRLLHSFPLFPSQILPASVAYTPDPTRIHHRNSNSQEARFPPPHTLNLPRCASTRLHLISSCSFPWIFLTLNCDRLRLLLSLPFSLPFFPFPLPHCSSPSPPRPHLAAFSPSLPLSVSPLFCLAYGHAILFPSLISFSYFLFSFFFPAATLPISPVAYHRPFCAVCSSSVRFTINEAAYWVSDSAHDSGIFRGVRFRILPFYHNFAHRDQSNPIANYPSHSP